MARKESNGALSLAGADGALPKDLLKSIVGGAKANGQHEITPDNAAGLTASESPAMSMSYLYEATSQSLAAAQNAAFEQQRLNMPHQATVTEGVSLIHAVGADGTDAETPRPA